MEGSKESHNYTNYGIGILQTQFDLPESELFSWNPEQVDDTLEALNDHILSECSSKTRAALREIIDANRNNHS